MPLQSIADHVMLDPSLLTQDRLLEKTLSLVPDLRLAGIEFSIPKSFSDALQAGGREAFEVIRYFRQQREIETLDLDYVTATIRRLIEAQTAQPSIVSPFEITGMQRERYSWLFGPLRSRRVWPMRRPHSLVLEIFMQEWVFLREQSWVLSGFKRPFEKFVRAGAVSIEFGKTFTDRIIRRQLNKKPNEILTKIDRLKGLARWIATGVSDVSPLAGMLPSIFANVARDAVFTLFDP